MTAQQSTPPEAALVAIDIAKQRNEVLIDPGPGMRRRRMTVLNAAQSMIAWFIVPCPASARPSSSGSRPTGNYHRSLAHRLIVEGFEVRFISGMALARTREALHNGWDKNDPKDAQVILHMLRIGATTVYNGPGAAASTISRSCRRPTRWSRGQDRALASPSHALSAALFSRDRALRRQLSQRLVPGAARALSDAGQHHRLGEGRVRRRGLGPGRPEGLQGALAGDIYETACTSMALPVPLDAPAIAMFRLVLADRPAA